MTDPATNNSPEGGTLNRPSSRRAVLAGAAGAAAAFVARGLLEPEPVQAADDGTAIVIGGTYGDAVGQTTLANDNNANRVLWIASNTDGGGAHGDGVAITGYSAKSTGVEGWSGNIRGVYGHALSSGVEGEATNGNGVYGHSSGWNQRGIYGVANGGGGSIGVEGWTASDIGTGVLGAAGNPTGANYGVKGYSASPDGVGVQGTGGKGVWGVSSSGVGVHGQATTGVALQTSGRTKLSTSGVATITTGSTDKTITPGVNVTSGSFVLLTPKVKLGGRDLWFTTDAANNRFTIHMSSSRSSGTKVAWLLLG